MAGKRGHGEGTLYKRSDGRWEARVSLPDGTRKSFFAKTRGEANSKRIAALRDIEQGLPVADERQTVAQYLDSWLLIVQAKLVPETYINYRIVVDKHILPSIGRTRLARLTAQQVQTLYAECIGKGLAPKTVLRIHNIVHRALESAVRLGTIPRNVADLVEKPRVPRPDIHPLNAEQARRYLDAARGDRLEALFVLALASGMRIGELLALRWADVDLATGRIRVTATLKWRPLAGYEAKQPVWTPPKTARSRRQIAIAPHVVEALKRHRQAQRIERLRAGPVWSDYDAVFCNVLGVPLTAEIVRRRRHAHILKRAGLAPIRFHDLRHTAATLLLGQRVNPKVVSEMLGHASISITLDIYSHVLPDMQQDAAAAMAVALGW